MIGLIGSAVVLLGACFCVIGAIGLVRFPDVYTRGHAAGVIDALGAGLIFLGLIVLCFAPAGHGAVGMTEVLLAAKLMFILLFMWVTGTSASHAVAKAAWLAGVDPWTVEEGGGPSKD